MPVEGWGELPFDLPDRLELPQDLVLGAAKLTVTAGRRVLVENHRGVLDYTSERVVVSLGRGRLSIAGTDIRLRAMNRHELLIAGRIQTLEFE